MIADDQTDVMLTMGLKSGFFYAYARSVTRGPGPAVGWSVRRGAADDQRDHVQRGVCVRFLRRRPVHDHALVVHVPRVRSRRFALIALACCASGAGSC